MSLGLKKLIKEARDNGFNEQVNQALYNYLGSLGVTGALNDRLYKYLSGKYGVRSLSKNLYLEGEEALIQRYFTYFRGGNSHHIQFPPIALPIGTNWKVSVVADAPSRGAYLLADRLREDSQSRFGVLNDDRVFGLSDSPSTVGGEGISIFLGTDTLRTYSAENVDGTVYVTIDGVQVHSFPDGASSPVLNSIGRQYNGLQVSRL